MRFNVSCRPSIRVVCGFAALLLWGHVSSAQSYLDALPVEVLLRARSFAAYDPFAVSSHGRSIAYVTEGTPGNHASGETGKSLLKILDLPTGTEHELHLGNSAASNPEWSPDARYLAFCQVQSQNEGRTVHSVSIWDSHSGRNWNVMEVEECIIGTFRWGPDSRHLIVRAGPLAAESSAQPTAPARPISHLPASSKILSRAGDGAPVQVYEAEADGLGQPPAADPWNISSAYDLVNVDVVQGHSERLLTRLRIGAFWISPDGGHIAIAVRKRFAKAGSQQLLYDITELNISTHVMRVLVRDVKLGPTPFTVAWSPDGRFLACRTAGMASNGELVVFGLEDGRTTTFSLPSGEILARSGFAGSVVQLPLWDERGSFVVFAANRTIWIASLADHRLRALARFPGMQVETIRQGSNLIWATASGKAIVVITRDEQSGLRAFQSVDLESGRQAELFSGPFNVDSPINMFVPEQGDSLFYLAESANMPRNLWSFNAERKQVRAVTHINAEIDHYPMGSGQLVRWRDLDGRVLHGALLLPPHFAPTMKYPLIVGVYGGHFLSASAQSFGFGGCISPINAQLLATRGYAVLCPDAPLSPGTPLFDLAKTVLPGINKLVDLGIADPDRIGVMGHSYGGYSVLCLLVQTKRFKAAVVSSGYADVVADYSAMDKLGNSFGVAANEAGQGLMESTPWQWRDRYLENSPFYYFPRIETPLLILHGSADETVPDFLADQVFVGLRRLGKQVTYARYEGEGHSAEAWDFEDKKDYLTRILNWFGKYLPANK